MRPTSSDDKLLRVTQLALSVARRKGVPLESAADIAQEVVIKYVSLESSPDNWEAWVTTVATNRANDYHGAGARRELPDDADAELVGRAEYHRGRYVMGPSAPANARLVMREVLKIVSDRDQQLLIADASGATNAEIAEQFGFANANTAAATVSRIKRRLRERFPELAEDPAHPRLY